MRDGRRAQRTLPDTADAHHGTLGQEGLHPHSAEAARHAEAVLRSRQAQVRRFNQS